MSFGFPNDEGEVLSSFESQRTSTLSSVWKVLSKYLLQEKMALGFTITYYNSFYLVEQFY